ncbi:ABC transporter ATP-binding protein [Endozoicomonas sp. Mp262]|uniref:ABC transporter ATP-binding protein n=1 Tax=Endozoicomonas sp. Mp262 TaxID=2919499 RepID=UPI0021D8D345
MAKTQKVIQLNDIQFSWKSGHPVLTISDLTITAGEKLFIRGPSGSGKTTLLGLIGGVLTPDQGSVNISGTDINRLSPAQRDHFRANHIGFIFQMFNLIPYLSVIENISLPLGFANDRARRINGDTASEAIRLLSAIGLDDKKLIKRPVTELSIGQQQRVAAARALIGQPDILIADEPTSALDTDTRKTFLELLFSECDKAGSTLLFVSHDPTLEAFFDRSIELNVINQAIKGGSQI